MADGAEATALDKGQRFQQIESAHVVPDGLHRSAFIAERFKACHYPHLFHVYLRIANPSHIHLSRCHPRHIVCQPGMPSCFRARNPPKRAVAIKTFRFVHPPLGFPNLFSSTASACVPKLFAASISSVRVQASILAFNNRTATMLSTAINDSSRYA